MPRERIPLVREKKKGDVVINIAEIFRNPDVQNQVVKNIKKMKQSKQTFNQNQKPMSKNKTRHSAKDGKFVSKEFAESNPEQVVEVTNHDHNTESELTTILSKYIQYIRAVEGSDYILDIDERKLSGIELTDEEWSVLTDIATAGKSNDEEN